MAEVLSDASIASIAPPTFILRAFAADYQALVEDPTSSSAAGIFLTPSGPAHQDALTKRKRLAHALADASRYAPNDSLYAAVAARPSVIPFNPGPSWLVSTLPPPTLYEDNVEVANALSAPVLTPVRPQGRPAALIPPSGSLVPTLGHRHPSHLTIGARVVASAELLKTRLAYDDPVPSSTTSMPNASSTVSPLSRPPWRLGGRAAISRPTSLPRVAAVVADRVVATRRFDRRWKSSCCRCAKRKPRSSPKRIKRSCEETAGAAAAVTGCASVGE